MSCPFERDRPPARATTEHWMQYGDPVSPPAPSGNMPPLHPPEFHAWPLDRRNAWWCEFNQGLVAIDKVAGPVTEGSDSG